MKLYGLPPLPKNIKKPALNFEFKALREQSYKNGVFDCLMLMIGKVDDDVFLEVAETLEPGYKVASSGLLKSLSEKKGNDVTAEIYRIKTKGQE